MRRDARFCGPGPGRSTQSGYPMPSGRGKRSHRSLSYAYTYYEDHYETTTHSSGGPDENQIKRDILLADFGYTGKMAQKFDRVYSSKLSNDRTVVQMETGDVEFSGDSGKLKFQAIVRTKDRASKCFYHHGVLYYEKNEKDMWVMYDNEKVKRVMIKCKD